MVHMPITQTFEIEQNAIQFANDLKKRGYKVSKRKVENRYNLYWRVTYVKQ